MSLQISPRSQVAFSLVELSIVLVILGLLVGGVLSGQSLIRAAELRAVSTEYSRFFTATQSFRDKYFANPGDMKNATQFWGRMNGNADCITNSSAAVSTNGACDGDADGILDPPAAASQAGEGPQYWRQLTLAGLIEGTYSGLSGSGGYEHCVVGTDCPRSKLSNSGWGAKYAANYGGDTVNYKFDYGNAMRVGVQGNAGIPGGPVLKPEEAWNIDTKIDDGKPGTGRVISTNWDFCTTATANDDYAGVYDLANSGTLCSLWFPKVF